MKKGIAVDTIILIILGVVVLGLVGYLIYKNATNLANTPQECHTQAIIYCNEWKATGFLSDKEPLPPAERLEGSTNGWYKTYISCNAIGFTWPDLDTSITGCKSLLGIE